MTTSHNIRIGSPAHSAPKTTGGFAPRHVFDFCSHRTFEILGNAHTTTGLNRSMTVGPAPPLDITVSPQRCRRCRCRTREFCTEGGQAPGLAASEPRTPDKAQQQQQQQQARSGFGLLSRVHSSALE